MNKIVYDKKLEDIFDVMKHLYSNIKDGFSLFENNEEFIFIGFDYILTGTAYSCLVNEKELIEQNNKDNK